MTLQTINGVFKYNRFFNNSINVYLYVNIFNN